MTLIIAQWRWTACLPYIKSIQRLFDLSGNTAVITGAASEIGKATTMRFAELDSHLILVDVNEQRLKS